jgi:hypothetical protein
MYIYVYIYICIYIYISKRPIGKCFAKENVVGCGERLNNREGGRDGESGLIDPHFE